MTAAPRRIPLSSPDINQHDIDAVTAVLRTPTLSLGPALPAFERAMAGYVGAKRAVAVSSGTAGLHCIVRALGLGPGDQVITTPFSFVASSNSVLFEGATPVFVDIDPVTWDLAPGAIEAAITSSTKAILPVHIFGRPCSIEAIREIGRRRGLPVIEDSCEALGTTVNGRHAGTFGAAGVFAFYPNKQMTTGEGGIIVTDDDALADHCASLRNQGRAAGDGWLDHTRLGYNYRLPDILCALGTSQLGRIEEFVAGRARVAAAYNRRLGEIPGVVTPAPARPGDRISWFVYVIRLEDRYDRDARARVLGRLREAGVECRNYFVPIHLQPFYRDRFGFKEGDFPVTEAIAARTIALPFHNRLPDEDIAFVADALGGALAAEN